MSIKGTPQDLFAIDAETDSFAFERQLARQGYNNIAGTDEAGRGPLAGPVVAASVILPVDCEYQKFRDSKQLAPKLREELFAQLRDSGAIIGVSVVSEGTIDRINILQASLLAMKESLARLSVVPDYVLVDGRHQVPAAIPQQALIKGDARSASIAAASIVAKVTRDRLMCRFHDQYPHYNFKSNKGYPTAEHRQAIKKYGPCPIHRLSFNRVKEFAKGNES